MSAPLKQDTAQAVSVRPAGVKAARRWSSTRALFWTLILLVASGCGYLLWSQYKGADWPDMPPSVQAPAQNPAKSGDKADATASPPLAPQVLVQLDRDFGYRIGDIVPVTIYVKQQAGTSVDLHTIALEGNFEIAGQETGREDTTPVEEKALDDGSKILRLKVKLQSFSVAPKLTAKMSVSYRVIAPNDEYTVVLPAIEVYTSNTWDQRDLIKTGELHYVQGWHWFINGALTLLSVTCVVIFWRLNRRFRSYLAESLPARRRIKRFVLARMRFDDVWSKIAAGDRASQHYEEIERIVRGLFDVETKTTEEAAYWFLYGNRGPYRVVQILHQCDRVIYRGEVLSEEDNAQIKEIFDRLVPHYPAALIAEVAALTAGPSERRKMRDEDPDGLLERLTDKPNPTD